MRAGRAPRSAVRLGIGGLQALAAVEVERVLRAAPAAHLDAAERRDALEVTSEGARHLGGGLGGDEDAVLAEVALRTVEECEAPRIVPGEGEDGEPPFLAV